MTKAKRLAVEEWAQAFITLTGARIVLAPEKFARFQKQGVDVALFKCREPEPKLAVQ